MKTVKQKTRSFDLGTITSGNTNVDRSAGLVGLTNQPAPQLAQEKPGRKALITLTPALRNIQTELHRLKEYSRLTDASPMAGTDLEGRDSKYYIDKLFPENGLLCLGKLNHDYFTCEREELMEHLPLFSFIVPAYMTAKEGLTVMNRPDLNKIPHLSPRCNANTGPLRYVVSRNRKVGMNDQARSIIRLARRYRLAMVVRAHPRSIEAWFPVAYSERVASYTLQMAATRIGASGRTLVNCEAYALPQSNPFNGCLGYRFRQSVIYFDPSALQP